VRLLLLVVAALVLAAPAAASEQHPTLAELEDQIMCPVCAGETLAQSDSPAAAQVKRVIQARIAAGDTRSEIKRKLVAEYGTRILAAPPKHGFDLIAWVLPIAGLVAAAGVLGLLAGHGSRVREPEPAADAWALDGQQLDPEMERRVDDELKSFDG
jgi:cytochrome c-type biogenesis protein CcmH